MGNVDGAATNIPPVAVAGGEEDEVVEDTYLKVMDHRIPPKQDHTILMTTTVGPMVMTAPAIMIATLANSKKKAIRSQQQVVLQWEDQSKIKNFLIGKNDGVGRHKRIILR